MRNYKSLIPSAIIPTQAGSLFNRIFNDFDSIFYNVSPKVDIKEDESSVIIKAEVAGLTRDDILIELEDDVLTISGERKSDVEDAHSKFYRTELVYGKFTRSFRIPGDLDSENTKAICENGILEITIPKLTISEKKAKQITIE